MTAIAGERTVLPPDSPEVLSPWVRALTQAAGGRATLVAPDGSALELPAEVFEVLRDVVMAMSQGLAITVAPQHTVLTTSEAAHLLGISRPTLVRLLEAGEIPTSSRTGIADCAWRMCSPTKTAHGEHGHPAWTRWSAAARTAGSTTCR